MTTKLAQLKRAFSAATPGEWEDHDGLLYGLDADGNSFLICDLVANPIQAVSEQDKRNSRYLRLAHRLMPTLIEAAALLDKVSQARATQSHEFDVDAWYAEVRNILEPLK